MRLRGAFHQHVSSTFPDMTEEEAYSLLEDCVREVQKRLIINLPNFQVKVVDKNGVRFMPDITVKSLK